MARMKLARLAFICALVAGLVACNPAIPPAGNYATITGTVTDAASGQPVVGANVTLSVLSTVTDSSGKFTLYPVPSGPYGAVVISAPNYQSYSGPDGTLSPGQVFTLNVPLTHS
jgi:hypothetical protein